MVLHKSLQRIGKPCISGDHSNTWSTVVGKARPVFLQKRKLKRRAGTIIRYGPQLPAVVLNNRSADRQSHTHALRLGGVESIEDLIEIPWVDPDPGVLHGEEHVDRILAQRIE